MQQGYAFCSDALAFLESFSVGVAVFSISLYMCLSYADGVPITNPRTPTPFTIVIFVPSNTFMAFFPTVFLFYEMTFGRLHIVSESLSGHIQFVQYMAETL